MCISDTRTGIDFMILILYDTFHMVYNPIIVTAEILDGGSFTFYDDDHKFLNHLPPLVNYEASFRTVK